jgi:sugar/nucleoside kinase (ribokinase family)
VQRLALASRVAAICVGTDGDWEGLPASEELDLLELERGAVRR